MTRIIGVRFRNVGKVYYFSPKDFDIYTGDHVIVETARGVEYGTVVLSPRDVEDDKVVQPLKDVIRVATPEDDEHEAENRRKEREAYSICLKKIREHELEMKLIDAEYTFDNNKVLFYFTADGRIDFRELVKDLAAVFKTRIELRQIGVRDETKILGGIGICGRPLCCHTYLSEFAPVSIKMAKEQNLSLNPTKISGTCGRLMCCMKNEQETYEYLNKKLPGIGDTALTPEGLKGEVQSVNVLRQTVKVLVQEDDDELELKDYKVEELKFIARKKEKQKKDPEKDMDPALMAELESLEEKPEDQKPAEKKSNEKKFADKKQGERKFADKKSADRKGTDRKPAEKTSADKSQPYKNQSDRKPSDKNAGDKRMTDHKPAQWKQGEKRTEKPSDRLDEKSFDRSGERDSEKGSDRERPKYRKNKNRGKEKNHDSQTVSERTPG